MGSILGSFWGVKLAKTSTKMAIFGVHFVGSFGVHLGARTHKWGLFWALFWGLNVAKSANNGHIWGPFWGSIWGPFGG